MSQDKKSEISPEGSSMYTGIFPEISTPNGIPDQMKSAVHAAEKELKDLRSKIEEQFNQSTTSEERAKYSAILKKLDTHYSDIANKTKEGTKGSLDSLREFMETLPSDQKTLVERAKQGISESTQKLQDAAKRLPVKAGDALGKAGGELATDAKKAAEAAVAGDLSQAKKLAEGITKKVNAAGQEILEYTGSEAFKKIFEPISENGIFGIFAVLGNLFKFFTNGFKFSEILGGVETKIEGAIDAGKNKVDTAKEQVEKAKQEASKFLSDPEYRKGIIERSLPKIGADISKEFYGGGNLSEKQMADLKEILLNAHYGQDTAEKVRKRVEENGALVQTSDFSDIIHEVLFGNADILWLLMSKGVVPVSRVAIHTVQTAGESYKFNMSVVFNKLGIPPIPGATFTSEELKIKLESAPPEMKQFMLVEMYRANGLFASLLGTTAGLAASVTNALLVDASTKIDGIDMFKKNWKGQFGALIKDFETLESAVLKVAGNAGDIPEEMKVFSSHVKQVVANFEILEKIQANPSQAKELANGIKSLGDPTTIKNTLSKVFGTRAGIISEQLDSLYHIQQYQIGLGKGDILSRIRGLFGSFEIMKMPRMADKVMLHFPSTEAANATLRQMSAFGPEFLQSFFRGIPVAGLVIAGVDASKNTEGTGMIDFIKDATSVLVPIVGPIAMFFDDNTGMKVKYGENGLEVQNLGTGLMAVGLLGVDTAMLAAHLSAGKPLGQFITSRVTDVAKFAGDISRYSRVGYQGITKLAPKFGEAVKLASKLPGKYKAAALAAIALGGSTYAWAKSHEDIEKSLIKDGYWDARTQDITPKFIEKISSMSPDEKKDFLDALFVGLIENKESNLPDTKSVFIQGKYHLITKNEADVAKIWEALNAHDSQFGQELRKLGIVFDVVTEGVQSRKGETPRVG